MTEYRAFSAVLDALPVSEPSPDEASAMPAFAVDYLAVADELHSGRITVSQDMAAAEYRDAGTLTEAELQALLADIRIDADPEPEVFIQLATDPSIIAQELALDRAGVEELARIRRRFAFANHPDRLPAHLRQQGMVRMQVANMLIDEATRSAARAHG